MPRFRSTARLGLQSLEGRDVPAGKITVPPISATGLLTITGDDDGNVLQIHVQAGSVVLSSADGTLINNSPNPVTINGVVKSIKADFKGGNDDVSIKPDAPIASDANFVLSGPVTFALGSGDNVLNLITTGRIGLGGLTVTATDGADEVNVQGGADSTIGNTKFTFGAGGSTTNLSAVGFTGGVTVTAGDAINNPNEVFGTNVTVARTFAANLGNSFPAALDFTNSTLGGLTATGYSVSSVLTTVTVTGNVTFKNVYSSDIQARGLTVLKNVSMTAPNPNFAAGDIDVTTPAATRITGNLVLTATGWTNVAFGTTTNATVPVSEVTGSVTVKGGWFTDVFDANEFFKVGKNLSLTLGGGDNVVNLGNGGGLVTVGGNLSIKGGAGNDQFTIDRVTVVGLATVMGFGGADLLAVEHGSTFLKTFTADLGAGDDVISIAQLLNSPNAVTFTGKAIIKGGLGNDQLLLGFDDQDALTTEDNNSRVVFGGVGSMIDGGLGLDFFDDATARFTGVVPIGFE